MLAAHDRALARLQRGDGDAGPFVLGMIENLVDPVLPDLLAVVREQLGDRPLQLRVDRSFELVERLGRGEVDAAIVVDPRATPAARSRSGRSRCAGGRRPRSPRAGRLPRARSRSSPTTRRAACATSRCARLAELGLEPELTAESPHLSGVHAAVRNGLGYALLAAGGDGLRAVTHGPLAETVPTTPLAPARARAPALAAPLRAALWRAATRRTLAEAA